ncbi:MAG: DinB family protein [Flavobacteriaceae bacterium]
MVSDLERELVSGFEFISMLSEEEMSFKKNPDKWSKKEILGHLIDSGINNLQRFTEIQFVEKPYTIRDYQQADLVKANDYQNSEAKELLSFWFSINKRIAEVVKKQTETTLNYKIQIDDMTTVDLRFLIEDYIKHLVYHLQQIKS